MSNDPGALYPSLTVPLFLHVGMFMYHVDHIVEFPHAGL
jgi:hypothetical protein